MKNYKLIILLLFLSFTSLFASEKENVVSQLLIEELEKIGDEKLPASWVYSGEGGVIKYAELDLVGDSRKEIIYDRTTRGALYKQGKPNNVYYQSKAGAPPVKIEGDVPLYGFHKKEGKKSIFIEASEGLNFDTPDEKAFTKKLTIREVTTKGVNTSIHIIDANIGEDLKEMWQATLFAHDKKSIDYMKHQGYAYTEPKYSWISLKDFVSGDFEWKDYKYTDWASLNEFSIDSMTWKISKELISPEFLELARQMRKSLPQGGLDVAYDNISLPPNYITPHFAYKNLTGEVLGKGKKSTSVLNKDLQKKEPDESDFISNRRSEPSHNQRDIKKTEETAKSLDKINFAWVIIGSLLLGILVILVKVVKKKATPKKSKGVSNCLLNKK